MDTMTVVITDNERRQVRHSEPGDNNSRHVEDGDVDTKSVADRLQAILVLLGISAREFGRRGSFDETHVTTMIGRLRRGGKIEIDTLAKLANGSGASIDWLMSGNGPPPRDETLVKTHPAFFEALADLEGSLTLAAIVTATRIARSAPDLERRTWIQVLLNLNTKAQTSASVASKKPTKKIVNVTAAEREAARARPAKGASK